jgi:hypothetical protein
LTLNGFLFIIGAVLWSAYVIVVRILSSKGKCLMRQRIMIFAALALGILLTAQPSAAQVYYGAPERHVEITPFIGYTLNTTTIVGYGEIKTDDGVAYGGTIGFDVNPGQQVEFLYFHQSTVSHFNSQSIYYSSFDFDVSFNYFMIGFVYEPNYRAKTRAFFRVGGGAGWASPSYQGLEDTWRPAMDLALGLKIYPTDKIGIRRADAPGVHRWRAVCRNRRCWCRGQRGNPYCPVQLLCGIDRRSLVFRILTVDPGAGR